jgi:hypothetical protein
VRHANANAYGVPLGDGNTNGLAYTDCNTIGYAYCDANEYGRNANTDAHLHAEFVPGADRLCRYSRAAE